MYPNENQQPTVPLDYLNQIAPKSATKAGLLKNKPILFGIIAVIVLLVVIIIGSLSTGGTNSTELLAARLSSIESVAKDATANIKNNQLLSYNSNLKIFITNTISEITPSLAASNINIDKLSDSVVNKESNTDLLEILENARLDGTYDRTYAREMSYKLETTLALMKQVYSKTSNKSLKTALEDAYNNLIPTLKQFADFNAVNS